MHFNDRIRQLRHTKKSMLCVGLDPDLSRMPDLKLSDTDAMAVFCSEIIRATHQYAIAFKLNFAFFEALGSEGWKVLESVRYAIPEGCLAVADAKRGDIGNSSQKYADAILKHLDFDAVTLSPYMGSDSINPFLSDPAKGIFALCLTSNPGADDFQMLTSDNKPLYLHVAQKVQSWNTQGNCGLVAGATRPEFLAAVRAAAPELALLVPGVGAQGGTVADVVAGVGDSHLLISASRSIIYASKGKEFATAAGHEAQKLQHEMAACLRKEPAAS